MSMAGPSSAAAAADYSTHQQPMSLIRVGGLKSGSRRLAPGGMPRVERPTDESDLLTIRILEASERKMRMIRELLSPEEFQSLSSDLFDPSLDLVLSRSNHGRQLDDAAPTTRELEENPTSSGGGGAGPESGPPFSGAAHRPRDDDRQPLSAWARRRRLTRSETNLPQAGSSRVRLLPPPPPPPQLPQKPPSLQESLAKRRRAVEFFFGDQPVRRPPASASSEGLAIELRFGYHLEPNLEAEDKLLDQSTGAAVTGPGYLASLLVGLYLALVRLVALQVSFCRGVCGGGDALPGDEPSTERPKRSDPTDEHKRLEREFCDRHKSRNPASPYSAKRNLTVFMRRLERDQQLHKFLDQTRERAPTSAIQRPQQPTASEQLECQLILIKTSDSDFSFRLASDLNRRVLALERARPLANNAATAAELKLLVQHPIVRQLTRHLAGGCRGGSDDDGGEPVQLIVSPASLVPVDTGNRLRLAFGEAHAEWASGLTEKVSARLQLALATCDPKREDLHAGLACSRDGALEGSRRHALLTQRWTAYQSAPRVGSGSMAVVYLSERENAQLGASTGGGDGSQQQQRQQELLDELKTRVKAKSEALKASQAGAGYKSIEQTRALALDYIRQCELLVEQILAGGRDKAGQQEHETTAQREGVSKRGKVPPAGQAWSARDILLEPRLGQLMVPRPSLPNLAQVVRALVPRPTARRPLMPNRGGGGRAQSRLSQLVELSQVRRRLQRTNADDSRGDLESAALDQWRRFASGHKRPQPGPGLVGGATNLRLVVTVQQASNVPLRLVQPATYHNQQQLLPGGYPANFTSPAQQLMRSSSPLYSPSPGAMMLAGGGGGGLGSPPMSPVQTQAPPLAGYLEPATTYVEAVFQRQQLASSLVQGQSPAWNETLFFGVEDFEPQLADECLHLNLYDCRHYLEPQPDQQPLDALSLLNSRQQQQQLVVPAQHQRIERRLLGSLEVPMSVLLTTSGRIEGSFALSQPLLLEHDYQHLAPQTGNNQTTTTNLSLFITLDPPVTLPASLHLPTGSHERPEEFEYARLWERVMLQLPARAATRRHRRQAAAAAAANVNGVTTLASGALPARQEQQQQRNDVRSHKTPHVRALVLRDDARYCLACRFLAPIEPPASLLSNDRATAAASAADSQQNLDAPGEATQRTMRRLARFVSLLNPLKHGHFRVRLLASALWFDSRQLLQDSLGGPEESAVLLCNFFLHLGKCAALLLADCVPEGRRILVLVWSGDVAARSTTTSQLELQVSELMETLGGGSTGSSAPQPPVSASDFLARLPILIAARSCQIWDPTTGACHQLTGSGRAPQRTPLPGMATVGAIVTPENVYANLQHFDTSGPTTQVNFDIRQRNLWWPLFGGHHKAIAQPSDDADEATEKLLAAVRREGRRILHVHNWRKQLAQLDRLARLIGRPVSLLAPLSQPQQFDFGPTFTRDQCGELREALERQIKSQLLLWRPTRPTYFNRTLSRLIAARLASFERAILSGGSGAEDFSRSDNSSLEKPQEGLTRPEEPPAGDLQSWWRAQLAELIRAEVLDVPQLSGAESRRLISWPVNVAYAGMGPLMDGLYASGVHNADLIMSEQLEAPSAGPPHALSSTHSTQFLVACHVEPYPARTMSVWLYVGALVASSPRRPSAVN